MITKMNKRLTLGLVVLVFIAGCRVGPNYKQPKYDLGKNYRNAAKAGTLSFADTSWTYLFKDTVLLGLIRKGLENNFDLKIAFERVNQARAVFKQARADLWPNLGLSGTVAENTQASPAGGTTEYHDFYATGNLSWEIDLWGQLRRAKESSRAQMMVQESFRQSITISLIAEIANNYFQLIEYQDELQITRRNERILEEALELVKGKMVAGTVSGLVVAQAETELAQIRTQIPGIEKTAGIQENVLHLLLGELPGSFPDGDTIINQMNTDLILDAGIPSRLIIRRPDIIEAEQQLVSANAQIGVARGLMLPSFKISAGIGYSNLGAGMIGSAVGNLVAPIFNFGKLRANVTRAKSYKEEILINYQKTIYTAISEVSNRILTVDRQNTIVMENRNLTAAAQTAYDLSNQLFNAGYASYLDVLNAQRLLFSAQINESQSYREKLISVVNLYLALGGGWK
jgi:multidrug efflux system outer membrane protein